MIDMAASLFGPDLPTQAERRPGFLLGWCIFKGKLLNFQGVGVVIFQLRFDSFFWSRLKH